MRVPFRSHDLTPILTESDDLLLPTTNPLGNRDMFLINGLPPPFDNPKIRQAAMASLAQEPFLQATIGIPEYYKVCAAMFVCDTPFAFTEGGEKLLKSDFEK